MGYRTVIGLEIHMQLATQSKIFCGCPVIDSGDYPLNTVICPVCLGLPGSLPSLNEKAVLFGVMLALATDCHINETSIFYRKHYFYPDLPKGYQITQYKKGLANNGKLFIDSHSSSKMIRIRQIHLEEDAGKIIHESDVDRSLIDYNRCGVPLVELVTEPDIESSQQAVDFVRKLRQIGLYLKICRGNMEKGNIRVDANISIILDSGQKSPRIELKNLNSPRYMKKALDYEAERLSRALFNVEEIISETRLFDQNENITKPMRSKEKDDDYRYLPEPNIPPIEIDSTLLDKARGAIPEMPDSKIERFTVEYGISEADAAILCNTPSVAEYFENAASATPRAVITTANLVLREIFSIANREGVDFDEISEAIPAKKLGQLSRVLHEGKITRNKAEIVLLEIFKNGGEIEEIIDRMEVRTITDLNVLQKAIEEVLYSNRTLVERYNCGEEKLKGFFIGEVMKKTAGRANPKAIIRLIENQINKMENR